MPDNQTTEASNESIDLLANDDASQTIADTGSERDTSNEQSNNNQTPKGETQSADSAATSTEASKADPKAQAPEQKQKFVTRGEKREQEIKTALAENKRILEEIRRERAQPPHQTQPNQQNQVQEPVFVEQPKKPQFSREEIAKAFKEAQASGNDAVKQACIDAEKEWERYETDLKFWKIENGQKIERFNSYRKHYWNEAVKRFPDITNQDSELYREAKQLASKFPEVLNRQTADGEYLIAQLAAMRIERKSHSAKVAALEDQVKQLTEKLGAAQKRVQPASQGVAPQVSKAGEGGTPEERLLSRLQEAKAA